MKPEHFIVYERVDDILLFVGTFLASNEEEATREARYSSERYLHSDLTCQTKMELDL